MEEVEYTWNEYAFFTLLTAICLAIFVYFGVKGTKTLAEYVWGSGEMGPWPIGLSLVATNISSLTLTAPNEVYQYGSTTLCEAFILIINVILIKVQAPVMYRLKLMSLNDYVEMRFGTKVKILTSISLILTQTIYLTLIGYSMALFFSQIMGISVMKCYLCTSAICMLLTALGGFRGVVWTDVLQAILILVCMFTFLIIGCMMLGGPMAVYEANLRGGRFFVSWSIDPTERMSVWSAVFSSGFAWLTGMSLFSPYVYQRYAALPNKELINKTLAIHMIGVLVVKMLSYSLGYVLFATYEGCDPFRSGRISNYDQTFAYFVRNIGNRFTIVRTIYIVGFTCSAVSTLTTVINTLSILIYKDYIQKLFNPDNLHKQGKMIMLAVGFVFVALSCVVVLYIQHAGTLFELKVLQSIPSLTPFCVLVVGMFMPRVRAKSVLLGGLLGLGVMQWLAISSKVVYAKGLIRYPMLEMRVDKCFGNETSFIPQAQTPPSQQDVFYPYRISGFYHTIMLVACIVGATGLFHCICGPEDKGVVDEELISPLVLRFVRRKGKMVDIAAMQPLKDNDEPRRNLANSSI